MGIHGAHQPSPSITSPAAEVAPLQALRSVVSIRAPSLDRVPGHSSSAVPVPRPLLCIVVPLDHGCPSRAVINFNHKKNTSTVRGIGTEYYRQHPSAHFQPLAAWVLRRLDFKLILGCDGCEAEAARAFKGARYKALALSEARNLIAPPIWQLQWLRFVANETMKNLCIQRHLLEQFQKAASRLEKVVVGTSVLICFYNCGSLAIKPNVATLPF